MQLKDILHYYLDHYFEYTSCGVSHRRVLTGWYLDNMPDSSKLHLRRLEDMTEREAKELVCMELDAYGRDNYELLNIHPSEIEYSCGIRAEQNYFGPPEPVQDIRQLYYWSLSPRQFHHLLSGGFDLFGGIDAGWAVDVNTLNNPL